VTLFELFGCYAQGDPPAFEVLGVRIGGHCASVAHDHLSIWAQFQLDGKKEI
jgi:hypothetical protein